MVWKLFSTNCFENLPQRNTMKEIQELLKKKNNFFLYYRQPLLYSLRKENITKVYLVLLRQKSSVLRRKRNHSLIRKKSIIIKPFHSVSMWKDTCVVLHSSDISEPAPEVDFRFWQQSKRQRYLQYKKQEREVQEFWRTG